MDNVQKKDAFFMSSLSPATEGGQGYPLQVALASLAVWLLDGGLSDGLVGMDLYLQIDIIILFLQEPLFHSWALVEADEDPLDVLSELGEFSINALLLFWFYLFGSHKDDPLGMVRGEPVFSGWGKDLDPLTSGLPYNLS